MPLRSLEQRTARAFALLVVASTMAVARAFDSSPSALSTQSNNGTTHVVCDWKTRAV